MRKTNLMVSPGRKVAMKDFDPSATAGYKDKEEAQAKLEKDKARLAELQDVFYAARSYALLIIFQAMDTAGKDGAIKHIMSGVNPQGVEVASFKQPSAEELEHDFLWRAEKSLPPRGKICIFNRSYYEEVLVVRVHAEALSAERVQGPDNPKKLWKQRFEDINSFERHLVRNGTLVMKFMLNLSQKEQKRRLLARIDDPAKNWKFSAADLKERACWDDYMQAYEEMLCHTSTEWAPWYVIPADHKWFTRIAVADLIVEKLKSLKLKYPETTPEQRTQLLKAKKALTKG